MNEVKRLRENLRKHRLLGQLEGMLEVMKLWKKGQEINKEGVMFIISRTIEFLKEEKL